MSEEKNQKPVSLDSLAAFARATLGLVSRAAVAVEQLQGRGSERSYFRVRWGETASAILVCYNPNRVENIYYADIAEFLREIEVPVPQIIRHDAGKCLILMEDLGSEDLWSRRAVDWDERRLLYMKALEAVHRLHAFPEGEVARRRLPLMDGFGPDLYRWEREYFMRHFVRDFCGVQPEPSLEEELEREFSGLAHRLVSTPRSLVHRDLQSQNIMLRNGKTFLIDFQGMRLGSFFYDLGSLLCDPYVSLSGGERHELLSFYFGLAQQSMVWQAFEAAFWEASVQRLMQALGAYGFLGKKKGMASFLEHIPAGITNLEHAVGNVPSLPHLAVLVQHCSAAVKGR